MNFDLHTHHFRCGHADGNIRDYIEAGIAAGLDVIGISDHSPYFGSPDEQAFPRIAMAKSELAHYVQEVLSLQQEYEGRIDVLLGMESDYFPEHAELYRKTFAAYPFDYVIGSVHHVEEVSIFNKSRWKGLGTEQQLAAKAEYYRLIAESARSGMFQVLGHIDAMKGNYPPSPRLPLRRRLTKPCASSANAGQPLRSTPPVAPSYAAAGIPPMRFWSGPCISASRSPSAQTRISLPVWPISAIRSLPG